MDAEPGYLEQPMLDFYNVAAVGHVGTGHPPQIRPMPCLALDVRLQCIQARLQCIQARQRTGISPQSRKSN